MRRRKRKTDYHHGNLRATLIECGLEMIEEQGIRALTLREIGKRLGVSRSAAYRHFKDKAALLSAIGQAGYEKFGEAVETAKKEAAGGFAAQMDAMAIAYAHFANEHRAHFEVMFNTLLQAGGGGRAERGRAFKALEATIREAQQQGEVREGDPDLLTCVTWALVHGASALRMDEDTKKPSFIPFSCEVLRSGLSDRPARPSSLGTPPINSSLRSSAKRG